MWRTRGHRPCRGVRCSSARRIIIGRAVKSQLHDGRISAETASAHSDASWNGVRLQVSLQHLPARPHELQHDLPLEPPVPLGDGIGLAPAQGPARSAASTSSDTGDRGCDCPPSTSANAMSSGGSGADRDCMGRSSRSLNMRDAAALTRRITRTHTVAELQLVVQRYRSQLNSIHVAAAIVKLAKLSNDAASGDARRHPDGSSNKGQQQGSCQQRRGQQQPWQPRQGTVSGPAAEEEAPPLPAAAPASVGPPSARSAAAGPAGKGGEGAAKRGEGAASTDAATTKQTGRGFLLGKRAGAEGKRGGSGAAPPSPPRGGATLSPSPSPSPRPSPGAPDRPNASTASIAAATTSSVSSSSPASLLHDLASAFLTQVDQYDTARQFANVVWALGTLRCRDHPQLLTATATRLLSQGGAKLASAQPQELSNLALGLAKLGYRGVPLWAAIIAAGKARLQAFKPQELHNLAWAVAAASQDRSMISAVVQAALPQLRAFNASGLANLLWACAVTQCPCEELFDGVAERLLAMPPEDLNSQDVTNTAWAFAKLQHPHPRLVGHLAGLVLGAGPGGLRRVATQELVNLLWAFASLLPPAKQERGAEQGERGAGEQQQAQGEQERWGRAGGSHTGDGRGGCSPGLPSGLGLGNGLQAGDAAGGLGAGRRQEGPDSSPDLTLSPGILVGAVAQGSGAAAASAATLPSAVAASGRPPQGYADGAGGSSSSSSVDTSSNNGNCGSIGSSSSGSNSSNGSTLLGDLVQLLLPEVARRADLTPQGISNALWAAGRAQPCPLPAPEAAALLQAAAAAARAGTLSDQELCNALWGAGQLRSAKHVVELQTLTPLLEAACSPPRLERLTPAGLSQVVHAVVALRLVGSGYMDELSKRVLRSLTTLGSQELCVVAAAAAEAAHSAKYCNPILMNGLGNTAAASVDRMGPQAMSTILWTFARAKHYHGPLTTAVCRAAQPRLREFSDLELSNLVWALAVLKCQDRQLLVRAAKVLVTRVRLRRQRQAAAALPRQLQQQRRRLGQPLDMVQEQQQPDQVTENRGGRRQQQRDQQQQLGSPRLGEQGQLEGVAVWAVAMQAQQLSRQDEQTRQDQHVLQPAHVQQLALAGQPPPYEVVVDGGQPSLEGAGVGSRPGSEGRQAPGPNRIADANSPRASSDSSSSNVSVEWRDNGGFSSGSSAAEVPPAAADALSATLADVRTRLRHIPLLHHPNDDTSVRLQPHRPPPRDTCADACTAANRRRDGGGDGAADAVGMAARCSSPADMPPPRPRSGPLPDSDADDDADGGAGLAAATARGHAKSMAKLLWAYAKCDMYNQPLYRLLAQELRPLLHLLTPHELTQVLWAVSYHGHSCPELLDAAAAAVLERLRRFSPTDASVVAWSYGKLRHSHPALMAALQRYAANGARFKQPCLGRLAWACAQLKEPLDERLVRQLQAVKQDARQLLAQSSYDGSDLAISLAGDASRVESDW